MFSALKRLLSSDPAPHKVHDAYRLLVTQARRPVFYREWDVKDTIDGRFDIIVLHLFLIISRLEKEAGHPQVPLFIRALTEIFFADMDRSLREMGVGDTGVGARVKKMAQAFYGRFAAYRDDASLTQALQRNVYRERPVAPEKLEALAGYVRKSHQALATQPADAIIHGKIIFLS